MNTALNVQDNIHIIQEMEKQNLSRLISNYITTNSKAIVSLINLYIMKEKSFIGIYEAMMFYLDFYKNGGIPHYKSKVNKHNGSLSLIYVEDGFIDENKTMKEVFDTEYARLDLKKRDFNDIDSHKVYNDFFYSYASDIVFNIQKNIIVNLIRNQFPNSDILGKDLVFDCLIPIDGKTYAYCFQKKADVFENHSNMCLGDYLAIGEKYATLYKKECERVGKEIDKYKFVKTTVSGEFIDILFDT